LICFVHTGLSGRVGGGGRGLIAYVGLLIFIVWYDGLFNLTDWHAWLTDAWWCLMMSDARIGKMQHTRMTPRRAQFTCVCACEWCYDVHGAGWGLIMPLHLLDARVLETSLHLHDRFVRRCLKFIGTCTTICH
jgi:hypothetical protein